MERVWSSAADERPAAKRLPTPRIEYRRVPAQRRLPSGPVAVSTDVDAVQLIALLNDALATGWVCAMRHQQRYYSVRGDHGRAAAIASLRQAALELEHADRIATRILELGGEPDLDPDRLSARARVMVLQHPDARAPRECGAGGANMVVECYRDLLAFVGDHDPATRRLLEDILAAEIDHARRIETSFEAPHAAPR
jgi:bacterioferritin